jgi:hypothetical protein
VLRQNRHKSHQFDLPAEQFTHIRVIFDDQDFLHEQTTFLDWDSADRVHFNPAATPHK